MGADVVVAELGRANAERTASEARDLGRRALAVPTDVTSRGDLGRMVERTRAEFGRIDILVNNAGIYRAAETLDVTEEHWDAVMNINAKAVFFAAQAVLPTMIAQKRGVIVSLASMAGKIGSRANLPYNASKAAVISMTKSLAVAHAADGIRVNCVCPGFVETDMWASLTQQLGPLFKPITRGVYPPQSPPDPAGAYGAAGGCRQCDRLPGFVPFGIHDGSSPQRRRRPSHARLKRGTMSACGARRKTRGARDNEY
jgi:NAD(P)-dependent dehydrogenase (short-subunit alcohol dehydrogenase family)